MYYLATLFVGWLSLNIMMNLLSSLIGFSINNYILIYIIIGFIVMSIKKIPSPLNGNEPVSYENSPADKINRIEFKLFFKEIYYTLWWPYYLLQKKS